MMNINPIGRFEEREVVNIKEDFNYPQYYIGGVFLKRQGVTFT